MSDVAATNCGCDCGCGCGTGGSGCGCNIIWLILLWRRWRRLLLLIPTSKKSFTKESKEQGVLHHSLFFLAGKPGLFAGLTCLSGRKRTFRAPVLTSIPLSSLSLL